MKTGKIKSGLTLIEMLVTIAMIITIVSLVYGSYEATSRSTHKYKMLMDLSLQGQSLLTRMAQQIRCAYAEPADQNQTQDRSSCFLGKSHILGGKILQMITTKSILTSQNHPAELLQATYRFDKDTGILMLSELRFNGSCQKHPPNKSYQPIARNIDQIQIRFFDGEKWHKSWQYEKRNKLPTAVKIEIICRDSDAKKYHYSTVAHIPCSGQKRKNKDIKTLTTEKI